MYGKRIKIFIISSLLLLSVCIGRLAQMQLITASDVQKEIADLKHGRTQQYKTLRGSILDRYRKILACDEPQFRLSINYSLSCYWDERVQKCMFKLAEMKNNPQEAKDKAIEEIHNKIEDIKQIITTCERFGFVTYQIEEKLQQINDEVWDMRTYLAWKRNYPNDDFEQAVPDANDRNLLAYKIDIAEMYQSYPLLDLKTDEDIYAAQMEFLDVNGVEIVPKVQRSYPYGTAAAQTIGWVGPAIGLTGSDANLFADDKLQSYLSGEVCGREDGVEYVCEGILRGSRGQESFDIDKQLISHTERKIGDDVVLTLDIELQKKIETDLTLYNHTPGCGPGMAAVVIDVESAEILAMVSLPVYDLNKARYNYSRLIKDQNTPAINRTINALYHPGSVVKPIILIAGMETGTITADKEIACPSEPAPPSWPNCWIFNRYKIGHSSQWTNTARNALKGSCNIYFSRLADMISSDVLQRWLLEFGYGREPLPAPPAIYQTEYSRNFRQAAGAISSTNPTREDSALMRIPSLERKDKKQFGIGQGNLKVTPLQVANTMATIARQGVIMQPRLFKEMQNSGSISLGISEKTLETVYEGMGAVVNESSGTANTEFGPFLKMLDKEDVKVFGKTGSTQGPEDAWFAGFAKDSKGHKIALAVVVEGGQHGGSDVAPLARNIIQRCIDAGYIGKVQ